MNTTRAQYMLGLLLMLSACSMGACGTGQAAEATPSAKPQRAIPVFKLGEEQLESSLRLPGELIAYNRVDVYAKVSAFVRRLHVDVGSEVKAGEPLASLEAPELSAQISEARSQLAAQKAQYIASKANYDRIVKTSETPGTISANDIQQAEARSLSDESKLRAAEAALQTLVSTRAYLEVSAPFSGVITERNVSPGAYVGPAGRGSERPLFKLQEQARLRLQVSIPEAYVGDLDLTRNVEFSLRSRPNSHFVAKVARRAGALDPTLRSEHIELDVDNRDKQLLPDMVAEVVLPLGSNAPRYVVPKPAVLQSTQGTFLLRVMEGKVEWVQVQLGRETPKKVEVFGPLHKQDTLVAEASEELLNGSSIATTDPSQPN